MCNNEWHSHRLKHNLDKTWICALCRDKFEQLCFYVLNPNASKQCWTCIHGLPPRSLKRKGMGFEVLGKKAYLLGGCGWVEDAPLSTARYDCINLFLYIYV